MLFLIPIIGPVLALGSSALALIMVGSGGMLAITSGPFIITNTTFPVSGLVGVALMALAF